MEANPTALVFGLLSVAIKLLDGCQVSGVARASVVMFASHMETSIKSLMEAFSSLDWWLAYHLANSPKSENATNLHLILVAEFSDISLS